MENTRRGDVSIDINGKQYRLVLDIGAMCAVEAQMSTDDYDATFGEIIAKAEKGSIRCLRALWWGTLIRHQPEITLEQASELIQDIGGLDVLQVRLLEVMKMQAAAQDASGVTPVKPKARKVRTAA